MGLFISKCPTCDADICWFLDAPTSYVCKCGEHVPANVIEKSWIERYSLYIERQEARWHFGAIIPDDGKS